MEYIVFHIPSLIIPQQEYWVEENGIVFFPSKIKSSAINNSFSTLGILIFGKNLNFENVKGLLTDSINFLSFCQPDYYSYSWLSQQIFLENDFNGEKVSNCKSSNDIVTEMIDKNPKCTELKDFVSFTYSLDNYQNAIDIIEGFKTYANLNRQNTLKRLIDLFSLARNCEPLLAKVYKNSNLKISLLFTILDEIMPNEKVKKEIKCIHCGHIHYEERNPKMQDRINQFVSMLSFDKKEKNLLIEIINHMRKIRNGFFHDGVFVDLNNKIKALMSIKSDNHFTIEDEIEHIEGRLLGILWIEQIIRSILFGKLSEIKN